MKAENMPSFWARLEETVIGGLAICTADRNELALAAIADSEGFRRCPEKPRARLVFDANGHGISLTASSKVFAELMNQADIIHADGGFIVTASRFIGRAPIKERSATTDLIHDIAKMSQEGSVSFFLLGGDEDTNRRCAERLVEIYPGLQIGGRRNGFFTRSEEQSIVEAINSSGASVLWVGLGKPLEQDFCVRNLDELRVGWAVTCGGCFNYITGSYSRAPAWMQASNLEWLHRLLTNPRKLFWRYLVTTPHALWLLGWSALRSQRMDVGIVRGSNR